MFYYNNEYYTDPNELRNVSLINGTCIFFDLSNSTEFKQRSLIEWAICISNSLRIAKDTHAIFKNSFVKCIGDELMFFIQDNHSLNQNYFSALDCLRITVEPFQNSIMDVTLRAKASIHYCRNILPVSFVENCIDYYGLDIDLTARLIKKATENTIVISEIFWSLLSEAERQCFRNVSSPFIENLHGIPGNTSFRLLKI